MRIAFTMKLHPGFQEIYRQRHQALWPEVRTMLKSAGIQHYSIFLDEQSDLLFAVLEVVDAACLETLPKQELMIKWWKYMEDIMETQPDHSPRIKTLKEVFYCL